MAATGQEVVHVVSRWGETECVAERLSNIMLSALLCGVD